jgi:hypothetical protein
LSGLIAAAISQARQLLTPQSDPQAARLALAQALTLQLQAQPDPVLDANQPLSPWHVVCREMLRTAISRQ